MPACDLAVACMTIQSLAILFDYCLFPSREMNWIGLVYSCRIITPKNIFYFSGLFHCWIIKVLCPTCPAGACFLSKCSLLRQRILSYQRSFLLSTLFLHFFWHFFDFFLSCPSPFHKSKSAPQNNPENGSGDNHGITEQGSNHIARNRDKAGKG